LLHVYIRLKAEILFCASFVQVIHLSIYRKVKAVSGTTDSTIFVKIYRR
jgi:hypothetical protein